MTRLDKTRHNVLLISYPSGGYGYYLTRLINGFVSNVVRTQDEFLFDTLGTSHLLPLVAGDIHHEQERTLASIDVRYQSDIDQQKYILIPYCPGIQNDNPSNMIKKFPNAKIIRLCYEDNTWPLVFQNCIVKAAIGNLDTDIEFNEELFGSSDNWARRENFILLFETHHYRNMWKAYNHERFLNIDIFELLVNPEQCLKHIANFINGSTEQLDTLPMRHQQFLAANPNTIRHLEILNLIENLQTDTDLQYLNQLYQQAVLNFYIQLKFNFVIPTNDYSDWFTNTSDIVKMMETHGVKV